MTRKVRHWQIRARKGRSPDFQVQHESCCMNSCCFWSTEKVWGFPSTTAAEMGSSIFRNIAVSVWSYSVGKHLTKDSWEPLNLQNNSPLSVLFCFYRSNSSTSLIRKFTAVGQRHEEGRRAEGRRRRGWSGYIYSLLHIISIIRVKFINIKY